MPRKARVQHSGSAERRKKIIEAALACFVEIGFAGATIEDIRNRSGASTGSIYHHFSGKEMLAAAVYLEGLADYQAGLLEELGRTDGAREGVRAIVGYHLRWVRGNPDWARYLAQMRHAEFMEDTEALMAELNRPFVKQVYRWLKSHTEAGTLRRLPFDLFLPLIIGPCQEYVRIWLAGKTQTDPAAAVEELSRAAWLAVRPQE